MVEDSVALYHVGPRCIIKLMHVVTTELTELLGSLVIFPVRDSLRNKEILQSNFLRVTTVPDSLRVIADLESRTMNLELADFTKELSGFVSWFVIDKQGTARCFIHKGVNGGN